MDRGVALPSADPVPVSSDPVPPVRGAVVAVGPREPVGAGPEPVLPEPVPVPGGVVAVAPPEPPPVRARARRGGGRRGARAAAGVPSRVVAGVGTRVGRAGRSRAGARPGSRGPRGLGRAGTGVVARVGARPGGGRPRRPGPRARPGSRGPVGSAAPVPAAGARVAARRRSRPRPAEPAGRRSAAGRRRPRRRRPRGRSTRGGVGRLPARGCRAGRGQRGDEPAQRLRRPGRRRGVRSDGELRVVDVRRGGDGLLQRRRGGARRGGAHRVLGRTDLDGARGQRTEPALARRQHALSGDAGGDGADPGAARRVAEQADGEDPVGGDARVLTGPDAGGDVAGHVGALGVAEQHGAAARARGELRGHLVGEGGDRLLLARLVRRADLRPRDGDHGEPLPHLLHERVGDRRERLAARGAAAVDGEQGDVTALGGRRTGGRQGDDARPEGADQQRRGQRPRHGEDAHGTPSRPVGDPREHGRPPTGPPADAVPRPAGARHRRRPGRPRVVDGAVGVDHQRPRAPPPRHLDADGPPEVRRAPGRGGEAGAVRVGAAPHGHGDVVDEQRHATRCAVDPQPHHRRGGHDAAEPVDELATAPHRPHARPSTTAGPGRGRGRGATGHTAPDRPRAVSIGERAGAWVRFRTSRRSLPECKAAATRARPAGRRPAAGAGSRRRPPGASCA